MCMFVKFFSITFYLIQVEISRTSFYFREYYDIVAFFMVRPVFFVHFSMAVFQFVFYEMGYIQGVVGNPLQINQSIDKDNSVFGGTYALG